MIERAVAVTELARFCHRSGDLDHRFGPSPTGPEGIAGHQSIYKRRPDSYQPEYPVASVHEFEGLRLLLRGRADGFDPQAGVVEEIKTCRGDPAAIPSAVSRWHMAQGRLYAAMIARQQPVTELSVRLTWLDLNRDQESSLEQHYEASELLRFLDEAVGRYGDWLLRIEGVRSRRNASAGQLVFPHGDFRRGQRQIAELAYKCVDQGSQLLIEAPTGIGKTAAVLYPAIKAMATGKHEKIAFLTAKTVGRLAAEDTLSLFQQHGLCGSALTLTAKERICFSPGKACHPDDCPYAQGYYDKLPAALAAAIDRPSLSRETVEEIAREHKLCPYELTQDLLPWAAIVIGDVHYLYSLSGALAAQMEADAERWSVLIDEAHNLPGRARTMYSAALSKAALMACKRDAPAPIRKALERTNRQLLALQNETWLEPDFHVRTSLPDALLQALADFIAAVAELSGRQPTLLARLPGLRELFFDCQHFTRIAQEWGEEFRLQLQRDRRPQSLVVTLNCLDAARLLAQRHQRAHAAIGFSATLSPLDWASRSLGFEPRAVCTRTPSPFSPQQLEVSLNSDIDTRYRGRQASLPALASALTQWREQTQGNCIVYFPSYQYMADCLHLLEQQPARGLRWLQRPEQGDEERQELLTALRQRRDVTAFCILGGVWGEGIDLPGDQLSSVVVVGVGLPQVNRETEQLREYYQAQTGRGFDFTFLYPGMQKVAQAIGRVIRTPSDRGSVLLIDPRYAHREYRQLLPQWWQYTGSEGNPGRSNTPPDLPPA